MISATIMPCDRIMDLRSDRGMYFVYTYVDNVCGVTLSDLLKRKKVYGHERLDER